MIELTNIEARIIGCLMEKSIVTPDQYPLTLNALTNACNQKSARNPVMSFELGEVQQAVRSLETKHVVRTDENFRKQTEKYSQRFCNTPFSDYQFDEPQYAVVCVLLLRGSRTPGEIRANSGRLHTFEDNDLVVEALESLINREGEALVRTLPQTPGRRDLEYVHLFGDSDLATNVRQTYEATSADPMPGSPPVSQPGSPPSTEPHSLDGALARITILEQELIELKALVQSLT
jgi:uncharacterized protein YceH (UPF0502 family)